MHPVLNLAPALDLFDALDEIQREQLFDPDADESHVQEILRHHQQDRSLRTDDRLVLDAWFARDAAGQSVGMALITEERLANTWHKLVNLYVHPHARGQGVGRCLLEVVLRRHGKLQGHYTADSIGLYEAMGLPDFFKNRSMGTSLREMNERHFDMKVEHALEKTRAEFPAALDLNALSPEIMETMAGPGRAHRTANRAQRRRGR